MHSEFFEIIKKAYDDSLKSCGLVVARGKCGVGKKYNIEKAINKISDGSNVLRLNANWFDNGDLSVLRDSIYKFILNSNFKKELLYAVIPKLALWIPGFGQGISGIMETKEHQIVSEIWKRSGIPNNQVDYIDVIKFIEKNIKTDSVILYCNNIQWFDKQTWNSLWEILKLVSNRNWLTILSYTTNAEVNTLEHSQVQKTLWELSQSPDYKNFYEYEFNSYSSDCIKELCDSILGVKTQFSSEEYNLIYSSTEGLPIYVKTILTSLVEKKFIRLNNFTAKTCLSWNNNDVRTILQNSICEKIKRVYSIIPNSKKILELGSAIKDDFTTDSVQNILMDNNCFEILTRVENKFRLIQYMIEHDLWEFEHPVFEDYIYHSLGERAKEIHRIIADYMAKSSNSYYKISLHYKLAGDSEQAAIFHLKAIRQLLETGQYVSALSEIEKFRTIYYTELLLYPYIKSEYQFLLGRVMFHDKKYDKAIGIFLNIIENSTDELELRRSHQWLARSYLKLHSQSDFLLALGRREIHSIASSSTSAVSVFGIYALPLKTWNAPPAMLYDFNDMKYERPAAPD